MQSGHLNESGVWAKLVSLNPSFGSNRQLTKDSYTIGRDPTNDIQILDTRVDDVHFRIYKDIQNTDECIWIENLSSIGIAVEDEVIKGENKRKLESGEKIGFLDKSEIILAYVFCTTLKRSNTMKRYRDENQKLQNEIKECEKQKKFLDEQKDNLECTICLSLMHNSVTVIPCLHNFCGPCITKWVQNSNVCPNCKQEYREIRQNYMLNKTINSFLEMKGENSREDMNEPLFEMFTLSDGSFFQGYRVNGRKEGKGKMIYSEGEVYEGDWKNDKREGKGKLMLVNGDVYEGDWRDGKQEGKGKYMYSSGGMYEGDWRDGKQEGKGKNIYSNGDVYEGDWRDGKYEGKGKYTFSSGRFYEGDWVNANREGKGTMIYTDGDIYDGDWVNNKREGKGKLIFENKIVYEGDWLNDEKKNE